MDDSITHSEIKKYIGEVDRNQDGLLQLDEFFQVINAFLFLNLKRKKTKGD